MPEWYVHIDPPLPVNEQQRIANCDIKNLSSACARIEQDFGPCKYELVILDDFTTYVWIRHTRFSIDIYPNPMPDEKAVLLAFIEEPDIDESEVRCDSISDLVTTLQQAVDA